SLVHDSTASFGATAFRRLWRPAAENTLGCAGRHYHHRAGQRPVSLAGPRPQSRRSGRPKHGEPARSPAAVKQWSQWHAHDLAPDVAKPFTHRAGYAGWTDCRAGGRRLARRAVMDGPYR